VKQLDSDYYVPPEFLDKFTVHIVKNVLDLPKIKVELDMLKLPVVH
jgi:hypothetical protein